MPVSLSQYHGPAGTFNNQYFMVHTKVPCFTSMIDNNGNVKLSTGYFILLNNTGLVVLLFNVMFLFSVYVSKYTKSIFV